jgi:hypothetical protein
MAAAPTAAQSAFSIASRQRVAAASFQVAPSLAAWSPCVAVRVSTSPSQAAPGVPFDSKQHRCTRPHHAEAYCAGKSAAAIVVPPG